MSQKELAAAAGVSIATVKGIEQGLRNPSDATLMALADALRLDPARLSGGARATDSRVHERIPAIRDEVDAYDLPEDGPVRPLDRLAKDVAALQSLRLASRYNQLARDVPGLLAELHRAQQTTRGRSRQRVHSLLAVAYRSADAAAYKYNYRDLSGRLIELMRSAAQHTGDPLWEATASYVRMELFFTSEKLATGLRMLQAAIDAAPAPVDVPSAAAVGALHMRAAVAAGRNRDADAAREHLAAAKPLALRVPESTYRGTAFGEASYRIHEVAVSVELGDGPAVLQAAREWAPPQDLPAERRSHFYIDVARAQLWENKLRDAEESLNVARRIAPQHVREHTQVHEILRSLLRLQRNPSQRLLQFAEWARAI